MTVISGQLPKAAGPVSHFIDIIGMPWTPLSFAGMARRQAYRTVLWGIAATAAAAAAAYRPPVYVATPPAPPTVIVKPPAAPPAPATQTSAVARLKELKSL